MSDVVGVKARKPISYLKEPGSSGYGSEKETMIPQEVRQQQLRKYKEAAAWMHY